MTAPARDAEHGGDGHVHLHVTAPVTTARTARDWAGWVVIGLGLATIVLFVVSFFLPWWTFQLYAPQYPKGLTLVIHLTGMRGDVHEIDLLNHYIGMKHLAGAAPTERRLAAYGVAAICIAVLTLLLVSGKKLNKWIAIPAILFPVVFLLDSFYWLYTFGHSLDPKAPLHIDTFTPQMFGSGQIGQFETFAHPSLGFWLAVAGVVCAVAAVVVRSRACAHCGRASSCSVVCPRLMVLPEPKPPEEAP